MFKQLVHEINPRLHDVINLLMESECNQKEKGLRKNAIRTTKIYSFIPYTFAIDMT